jgi:hypothetical protein
MDLRSTWKQSANLWKVVRGQGNENCSMQCCSTSLYMVPRIGTNSTYISTQARLGR